uniref:Tudor domain-containing protein n=1 Tax=Macrostomum lignano TaxID=282301 RepID=A0A1I8GK80_9PLAT
MKCSRCKENPPTIYCTGCTTSNGQVQLCSNCFFEYHVGPLAVAHKPTLVSKEALFELWEKEKQDCATYLAAAKHCSQELQNLLCSKDSSLIEEDCQAVSARINADADAIVAKLAGLTDQVNSLRKDAINFVSSRYDEKRDNLVKTKQRLDKSVTDFTDLSLQLDAVSSAKSDDELLQKFLSMNQMKPSLQRCLPSENLMDTDPTGWYALPLPANSDILASLTELKHRLDKLSVRQECDGALGQTAFNYLAKDLKSLTANSDKSRRPIVRCCLLSDLSPYGIFTACQASPVRFELISHIQSDLQLRRAVEPGFRTVLEACSAKATSPLALRPDQRVYAMSRDGTWGRGRVLSESSASVSVRFFDLGKTENISRDRIVDAESDTRYSAVPELSFECCLAEPAQQAVLKDPNWFANRIGGQDGRAFLLRSAGECRFRSRRVLRVEAWPDNDTETDHAVVDEDFAAKLAADFSDLLTGAVKETVSSHAASHHRDIRLQENPDLPRQVYTFSATTAAARSSAPSVALNAISPFEEEFAPLICQGMLRPIADDEAGMLNGGRAVDSDAEGLDYAEDDEDNDQVVVLVDRNAMPPPTSYHHGPHPSQQPPVTMSMQPMHHPVIVPVSDCIAAGAIVNGGSSTNGRNNGTGGSSTSPYYYSEPRPEVECAGNSAELHDDEVPDNGERNEEEEEEKEEEEECGHNAEEDAEEYDVGDEPDERDGHYDDQEAEEADEDFHEAEESPFDSLSGDERRWTSCSANWEDVVAADEKAKADSAAAAEALKKTERSSDGASPQTTPKLASPAPPAATSSRFNGWQYNVLKNTLQKRATSPDTTAAADAATRQVQPATGQQPRQQSPMTGDSRGGGAGLRQPRRDERGGGGGGGFRGGGDRGPGTK